MKLSKIVAAGYWLSPLLKLGADTAGAVYDDYSETYIKDPGHRIIKILDAVIIVTAWVVAILITYPSIIYYANSQIDDQIAAFLIIFFPYFSNIHTTVLLYANSFVLSFYNKNRKNIIRKINEKKGVW